MTTFLIGIISLVVYIAFDKLCPKKKQVPEEHFNEKLEFKTPIIDEDNIIFPYPKVWDDGEMTSYRFRCQIKPSIANVAGKKMKMVVPEEWDIDHFTVIVVEGEIRYVYLGSEQYHADHDPISKCFCLTDLYREDFTYDSMAQLLRMLGKYDLCDSYRVDHWEHKGFISKNKKVIEAMSTVA